MGHYSKNPDSNQLTTKEKLKTIKKERKLKLKEKRARLVIRNLPFNATQENLQEHFGKFGDLESVEILKKEDGKLVGCAFVQFKLVQKAAKAKHHCDGKSFLGRDINVDFALAKNKFKEKKAKEVEVKIKDEPMDFDTSAAKSEDLDVKLEENVDETNENKVESEEEKAEAEIDQKLESEDDSNSEMEPEFEEKAVELVKQEEKRPKFESNDVGEGRTVFIKNVPFTATNSELKETMRQFGPIFYALICMDKFTEHSKGTAFVKFQCAEDAEKALGAGTELTLLGSVLDCHRALNRGEVGRRGAEAEAAPRDARNLYLVKEGVVLAGSAAAEGVSQADMAKRLQLEQYKTQMLRNLNMFVASDRLIVHNLPPAWDDRKLRALVLKFSPRNAQIKEARVMRDLKQVDERGVGRSKEHGFVAFNRHEDAIFALRGLNNNPNVFSAARRPIVAFSIENRTMIRAKEKRLERSKANNPKCGEFGAKSKPKGKEVGAATPNGRQSWRERKKGGGKEAGDQGGQVEKFAGVTAKQGVQKMRSRYNLKTQAQLHFQNLKKEKKQKKLAKKVTLGEKRAEFTKQDKQKIGKKKNKADDNFSQLVAGYKQKLASGDSSKKTKWYE